MVAQKNGPLTVSRYLRRLPQNINNGKAVFLCDGHIHARHQRKVKCHVAFVALAAVLAAEIQLGIFRPLVGFREQHAVGIMCIEFRADFFQYLVGFRQVFVIGAVALDEIWNRIQPQTIDAQVEPEAHYAEHFFHYLRIIKIKIRLMRIKAVPEILASYWVPGPVGVFRIKKNNARAGVFLRAVGPDVIIPCFGAFFRVTRSLEPRMLIRGVINNEFGNHT